MICVGGNWTKLRRARENGRCMATTQFLDISLEVNLVCYLPEVHLFRGSNLSFAFRSFVLYWRKCCAGDLDILLFTVGLL